MSCTRYFLPAEWHSQSFIQLAWPHEGTDWRPYLGEITATVAEIAAAITRFEDLLVVSQEPESTAETLRKRLGERRMGRVRMARCQLNDTWTRDYGALTLLSDGGGKRLLDFRFNGWGGKYDASLDNEITRRLHADGFLEGELIDQGDLILEGGSIESDGRGTVFTTSRCLLAPHRNQPLSQRELEDELKRRLCAERVVWLNHGMILGDDTDGHIDTIVRVAPDDTILYVRCAEGDPQHADFAALEQELKALRTLEGKPYRLLPLPMPRPCHFGGERLPATYANFLVLNGAVLVPTYGQPDSDSEACRTIAEAFPDRQIVPLDSTVIIRQHGSIHCLAMQYFT